MRYAVVLTVGLLLGAPAARAQAPAQKPLDIYFIDVEGGQATLLVAPSGESMLVDTGFPGYDGRDLARIESTAKQAGVSRIDYLVITHYHTDHVGNVPALAPRIPIRTFVDHGPTVETGNTRLYDAYVEARKTRASSAGQAGRQDSDRGARRDGGRGRRPGPRTRRFPAPAPPTLSARHTSRRTRTLRRTRNRSGP